MTGTSYRAEPELIVRPIEDVTLIYHRRSGQTHMVVSPVPEILAVLAGSDEAFSIDAIVARLAGRFDLGDPVEAAAAVAVHLEEMAALGLARHG